MSSWPAATVRWCAIFVLGLVIAVCLPLSWLLRTPGGGLLWIAEWAKDVIDELRA